MIDLSEERFFTRCLVRMALWAYRLGIDRLPGYEATYEYFYLLYKRYFDSGLHLLTRRHPELFAGGHIVDIGANIGSSSLSLVRVVTPNYRLYALEPEERNYRSLKARFANEAHCRVLPLAIGATNENGMLATNAFHRGDHRLVGTRSLPQVVQQTQSVCVRRFDTFLAENGIQPAAIQFVKIDVQGGECAVLQGMESLLASNQRVVLCLEFSQSLLKRAGMAPSQLVERLERFGFTTVAILTHRGKLIRTSYQAVLKSDRSLDLILGKNSLKGFF